MTVLNLATSKIRSSSGEKALACEVGAKADFSRIRYAQCWEDADLLLRALGVRKGDVCLSIASAGDNTLALLACKPARVVAVDLSFAQLACLELRVAAYQELDHAELLELVGAKESIRRTALYQRCRVLLSGRAKAFWDMKPGSIARGIGHAGKFERYFEVFRTRFLPWIHSQQTVRRLLEGGSPESLKRFYHEVWNTWRWRLLFKLFFSRFVMGRMGRDPSFFRYVEGNVSGRIMKRAQHALTELNPAENPYLQWIIAGSYQTALPFSLRYENFDRIRNHLDRLEWHCSPLESYLDDACDVHFNAFNLSDIFEYISEQNYHRLLEKVIRRGHCGARLAYWNTLADRRRPEFLQDRLRSLDELSRALHWEDKAFFYCAFVVEEII